MKTPETINQYANYFTLNRRRFLSSLAMLPASLGLMGNGTKKEPIFTDPKVINLPCPELFSIDGIYLNAAYTHPMSIGSAQAVKDYLDTRMQNGKSAYNVRKERTEAVDLFAKLINANPEEIAWIPSTMVGENIIASGLGLPTSKHRVVTDAYHFDGSLYMYGEFAKQGLDLHIVEPKNNKINLEDMDAAITSGTKLVAVSLVSMINGFEHDLKSLCEIAHAKGALVYADIIQAAGAVPIDVKESGIDFCACSTFKWLMGDFGSGFLYVNKDSLKHLKRSQYGYRQLTEMDSHIFPFDEAGTEPFSWKAGEGTSQHFEVGTLGNEAIPALKYSLELLTKTGVENIQNYRKPMIELLQKELPKIGYQPMTPNDSSSPIISFAYENATNKLKQKITDAKINIQLYENRLRVSPSIYNSMEEIEMLVKVLKTV